MPTDLNRILTVLLAAPLALAIGCGEGDKIRSYVVPPLPGSELHDPQLHNEGANQKSSEPTDRMLAAIVHGKDQAWFYKLTAGIEQANEVEPAVLDYFQTIKLDEASGKPAAELPEGWTDRGGSGMRHTTLMVPTESGDELELSVTALGSSPDWDGLLLSNLNRWRGQMGQPPIAPSELSAQTVPLKEAPAGSVAMDIVGWSQGGGMTPPFASRGMPPAMEQPKIQPPQAAPASKPRLSYDKPKAWVEAPASSMRLASLKTSDKPDAAEVTVFAFAAAGAMGDPLANVNRWRGQVGLSPTTQAELDNQAETVNIDGVEGEYVELTGEQGGMLAAMATRGPEVWFFKLSGDPTAPEEHRDEFKAWLKSVRFAADESAPAASSKSTDETKSE